MCTPMTSETIPLPDCQRCIIQTLRKVKLYDLTLAQIASATSDPGAYDLDEARNLIAYLMRLAAGARGEQ